MQFIDPSPGLTDTPGFLLAATSADIRGKGDARLDLALLFSEEPETTAAGVFTTNAFPAAPVRLCQDALHLSGGRARAVLINSGNANACTGPEGLEDARALAAATATATGLLTGQVLVGSTGRIGRRLPLPSMLAALPALCARRSAEPSEGARAAQAILTSDTRPKTVTARLALPNGATLTIAGMAKGAGMIQPGMATMLAYLTTDAALAPTLAQRLLRAAVDDTFNAITVDGDMSTNDTVLLLANGRSRVAVDDSDPALLEAFRQALHRVCAALAEKIVGDGEKITRVVEVIVGQAASRSDAEHVARAIGNSLLVKSSWFGADPNWGRILDAAGYARVPLDPGRIELDYDATPVFRSGRPLDANLPAWKAIVARPRFSVVLRLAAGHASYRLLASDLTPAYVDFNKSE